MSTRGENLKRRWQRLKPAVQFVAAAALLIVLGMNANSLVESFRRRIPHEGWKRFRPPHETAALLVDGTDLWAGGRDGLSLIDWKRRELLTLPRGTPSIGLVRSILRDSHGTLWVGHGNGIDRRIGGLWSHIDTPLGAVEAVIERRNGEIWAGGEKGLARLDNSGFQMVRDSAALGLQNVFFLFEDSSGALWIASESPTNGGLVRLSPKGVWETYTHNPGLAHTSVSTVFEDRDGALWFATGFGQRGGACRLKDEQWNCLRKMDGLTSDRVRTIYQDSGGRFWIGSETNGLAYQSGQGWRALTPDQGMTGWEVKRIVETPDDTFWMGTEDGVTMINNDAPELMGGWAK